MSRRRTEQPRRLDDAARGADDAGRSAKRAGDGWRSRVRARNRHRPLLYSGRAPSSVRPSGAVPSMSRQPLTVAIVGATGVVGRTMIQVLTEREFPMTELRLLASGRS